MGDQVVLPVREAESVGQNACMARFDWAAVERAAVEHVVSAVRSVRESFPDEHIYGVMFHEFYGDGTSLSWPLVTVGTEESLVAALPDDDNEPAAEARAGLRWSGADLEHTFDPGPAQQDWGQRCQRFAAQTTTDADWERIYDRFLRCFPAAAKRAGRQLIGAGVVTPQFVVVAADEVGELIVRSLTRKQLGTHFPQYASPSSGGPVMPVRAPQATPQGKAISPRSLTREDLTRGRGPLDPNAWD